MMLIRRELLGAAGAAPSDPYFENVTLLLHGDGTNGGQNNTFVDSSTNNFTITRNGNTTQGSFSPYGDRWSNYFDGNGDYLSIPASSQFLPGVNTDFTCEAWVNMSAVPSAQGARIVGTGEYGTNSDWALGITSASLPYFYINVVGGYFLTSSTAISVGTWNHIAVSRSGTSTNNLKMFLNGVLVAQATQNVTLDYNGNNLTMGADANGDEENYTGYISNVRFINGSGIYTAAFTPSTTPLTAITNTVLLTCQSNRFRDNSSNNFTITRNGDVSVQRFSPFSPTAAYSVATIGGSGYFDGSGDTLDIPTSTLNQLGTGSFCVEAWIYLENSSAEQFIVANASSGGFWFGLNIDGANRLGIGRVATAVDNFVSFTWTNGQWYHVAVNRNGTSLQFFVNGTQVGSTGTNSVNYPNQGYRVGSETTQKYIKGYMSDFRITKASVYTSAFTPPTSPLTNVTNTAALLNFTNASIFDNAMMADLETVGNAQIDTTIKKYGTGSLEFDGNGDYITFANNPAYHFGTGNFTVEAWVYPTATPATNYTQIIGAHEYGLNSTWILCIDTNLNLRVYAQSINGANVSSATGGTIPLNSWSHLAMVRSGTTMKGYINGVEVCSVSSVTDINSPGYNFSIGADTNGDEAVFTGYIDDIRITKGIARYTSNFTPPTAAFPNK